jgi:phosphoribosyl 1,2-cyclic phosphodiesterase
MRLLSIASGSSGNCIYIGDDNTHILIDAGISKKRIEEGLNTIDLTLRDLDAVFVTHEHIDHIGGLGVLTRKCTAPVYATKGTLNGIFQTASLGKLEKEQFVEIEENHPVVIGDITVDSMKISHDANQPVAYRFFRQEQKIAIATDLGTVTEENEEKLKGMDAILLEANHDVNMLQVGPYPYYLKQRILGNTGHLSNENAGRLLSRIVHDDMKYICLGHLSKENNVPALAYEAVRLEITMGDNPYQASDFRIDVAKRNAPSQVVTI